MFDQSQQSGILNEERAELHPHCEAMRNQQLNRSDGSIASAFLAPTDNIPVQPVSPTVVEEGLPQKVARRQPSTHAVDVDQPATETLELPEVLPLRQLLALIPSSRPGRKLSISTLYRWILKGHIPTFKIGGSRYVRRENVARLLEGASLARTPKASHPLLTAIPPLSAANTDVELERLMGRAAGKRERNPPRSETS
jgi:hypothetical protein